MVIESCIEEIWGILEEAQAVMDEMSVIALRMKDSQLQSEIVKESDTLQEETQKIIESAEDNMTDIMLAAEKVTEAVPPSISTVTPQPLQNESPSPIDPQQAPQFHSPGQASPSVAASTAPNTNSQVEQLAIITSGAINRTLKALRVLKFDGNRTTFEEFWCLFESLVDKSTKPVNIKMARFRECLSGRALEAICGLGVSEAKFGEAKEIFQSKFGGERRQLREYMEELEKIQPLRNTDVASFDRFTDLVRVTVAKLKAEGREAKLREGTLHGQLVKKLSGQQVESYSRWLNVHNKAPSVIHLCEWLEKEVAIKMEAVEMAHGLEQKPVSDPPFKREN